MERAGPLLGKIKQIRRDVTPDELARSAWPVAVGKKIAARTTVAGMVRSTLVVEVEDPLWKRNLFLLRGQILSAVQRALGPGIVEDIRFRVGNVERREPQREERARDPETAAIEDPVLRRLYAVSKKNATR